MKLDLSDTNTITTLVIVILVLFAIIYVWMNRGGQGKEGFTNFPVAAGDMVQLQGGLASVMDGTVPVPASINNMIQQALTTYAASQPPAMKLFGIMNYTLTAPAGNNPTCYGYNQKSSIGTGVNPSSAPSLPQSPPGQTLSTNPYGVICLFNWNIPTQILNDTTNNTNMKIVSSMNPNSTKIYSTDNIFNNKNLDNTKKYLIDLTFTSSMHAYNGSPFHIYLITFDNFAPIDKINIGYYFINNNDNHFTYNLKFIVPPNPNMVNWGIYLFSFVNGSNFYLDYNDNINITVYTI